tara:strand:+ start:194 stop:1534 length:1341 start_codon:yes stop_codon:yes gene_type:complete
MSFKAYEEYEDSGIEWLGEVPAHWEIKRIRHLFTCLDGKRVPLNSSERHQRKGNIPYWGANKIMDYVDDALFDEPLVLLGEDGAPFFDRQRDVAFSSEGPVWPNNHIHVLKPHDQSYVSYTVYSLNSTDYIQYVEGSTRDKLTQANMMAIPLAWPDRCERTNIAAFLDHETARIDALIEEQQRLIALLKEKRQAVISHAVTKGLDPNLPMKDSGVEWLGEVPAHWEVVKFGVTHRSATLGGNYISADGEEGVPLIKMGNISRGEISTKKIENLRTSDSHEREHVLKEGDFLFNTRNSIDLVGKVCIWRNELPLAVYNSNILKIEFEPFLVHSTQYMNYLFNSKAITGLLKNYAKGTTSVAAIYYKDLQSISVPIPTKNEQAKAIQLLDNVTKGIDDLILEAKDLITLVKERRSALISAAVTGKIDVRDWQPPKAGQTASEPAEVSA